MKVDDRSSSARGLAWATQITSASIMMVLPALAGYYLDQWLGTVALFLFLGALFGLVVGGWNLIKMVQHQSATATQETKVPDNRVR